jgi:uncharacterized damage-inducible protein DinB
MNASYFQTFARYNQWANARLYDACAKLDTAEYFKPRQAFFGSIHATLNHLLVGDRIWLSRIEGTQHGIEALDQILYGDFGSLRSARAAEDARVISVVGCFDDRAMPTTRSYRSMAGDRLETRLDWILAHVFNHQTHHRGQVHDMLSQTPVAPPSLDLFFYLREHPPG